MSLSINHFSFENHFWIRVSENVTSFGLLDKQNDIHFSISHHKEDEYLNFHITKNTPDEKNKLKYEVVRVKKMAIEDNVFYLFKKILDTYYQPLLKPEGIWENKDKLWFLSTEEMMAHPGYKDFENGIFEIFKDISVIKGNKKSGF